jgi:hypothetical protein
MKIKKEQIAKRGELKVPHKIAAEVFGRSISQFKDKSVVQQIIKEGYISPYTGKKFKKVSRLLDYPMGIDVVYWKGVPVIIDPDRFLQGDIVFKDIANRFIGGENNVIRISEVKLKKIGSFDFVLCKHEPLGNKINDFVITEIQSDSTTGTGKLVQNLKDIMEKGLQGSKSSYAFGMNTYNTIKLSFVQMLKKGLVAEGWNKNIVWVMQDFVFQNMLERFEIKENEFSKEKRTHYFIYSLVMDEKIGRHILKLSGVHSYTVAELRVAFDTDRTLPSLEQFMKALEKRVETSLHK